MAVPTMRVILVTPAIAEEWLEKNKRNRRLSQTNVDKYANLMRQGHWLYDASPIRFDEEDNVIDGQHRLWAVIETGLAQKFLVVRGLAAETFATIDTGKVRSFADILSVDHSTIPDLNSVAATVQIIQKWKAGARGKALTPGGRVNPVSNAELVAFFEKHKDVILHVTKQARALSRSIPGMTPSALALLFSLFNQISTEDADYFFDRLADGVGLEEGSPILVLRETLTRFVRSNPGRRKMPLDQSLAITIKAWNYFRSGDSIKVLSYRAGGASPEGFPVPS